MDREKAKRLPTVPTDRREFLRQAGTAVLGAAALGMPGSQAAGANDRIVLGVIGPGGQGSGLLKSFAAQKDVDVAYVCDPDANRMTAAAKAVEKASGKAPRADKDMRRIFDDRAVDAVVIATPDHWHAPATILACDAGKHVYVEKPCSHNIREGRLMIEAARRSNRVVQVGTQTRSAPHVRRAMELLHSGAIGEVLVAKVWNSQPRANICHAKPSDPPAHLGNIATRVGRVLHFDPAAEQFTGDNEANGLIRRTYREGHWAVPKEI
jgi:predicted dehydrogenase